MINRRKFLGGLLATPVAAMAASKLDWMAPAAPTKIAAHTALHTQHGKTLLAKNFDVRNHFIDVTCADTPYREYMEGFGSNVKFTLVNHLDAEPFIQSMQSAGLITVRVDLLNGNYSRCFTGYVTGVEWLMWHDGGEATISFVETSRVPVVDEIYIIKPATLSTQWVEYGPAAY